jgi:EAL domain-containing protein (putative c-di-GMP-specific phosphodiesterase class I)/CheY-like chemotaxis protein
MTSMISVNAAVVSALPSRGLVLAVDDEPSVRRVIRRVLEVAGFTVESVANGKHAIEQLSRRRFDAIISDVAMPELDGIGVLRAVRDRDLDLPVLLLSGSPTLDSALAAIEHGAMHFLRKPIVPAELIAVVERAVQLGRVARVERETATQLGDAASQALSNRAGLEVAFTRALEGLWMAYQPIVRYAPRCTYAYEALMRSTEKALPHPGAILDAAQRLGRLEELGRVTRARVAATLTKSPTPLAFVNLHAMDLLDEQLWSPQAPLSQHARRVVLELTERASLDGIDDVPARLGRLRELGYRIAIDDMGAGYASLSSLAQLQPEVVKLDMALIRDVDVDVTRQKLIAAMVTLCKEMNIEVIAEGVETPAERDTLSRLGADLMQGYLFAKPGLPFPEPTF